MLDPNLEMLYDKVLKTDEREIWYRDEHNMYHWLIWSGSTNFWWYQRGDDPIYMVLHDEESIRDWILTRLARTIRDETHWFNIWLTDVKDWKSRNQIYAAWKGQHKMLRPGQEVTNAEVQRIQALSPDFIRVEIETHVMESGIRDVETSKRMRHILKTYYQHAHKYRYVPDDFSEIKPTICLFDLGEE